MAGSAIKVIAHRGASGHEPENTLSAFLKAKELLADMVEFDVSYTKDKVPVIFHDKKIHRLTGGRGNISDYTYDKVKELKIKIPHDADKIPEHILTLAEGLEVLKDMMVNIEIKPEAFGEEKKLVETILSIKKPSDVIISSFNYKILEKIREINNKIPLGGLSAFFSSTCLRKSLKLGAISFHPKLSLLSSDLVRKCHESNLDVYVWTCNTEKEMRSAIVMGADGIFTNYPDKLRGVLDAMR